MRSTVLLAFAVIALPGCAGGNRNSDCRFPLTDAKVVGDPSARVDQAAVDREALLAEDLAIRYADRKAGRRAGWPVGRDGYRHAREQCMSTLFEIVGRRHGVAPDQVRAAVGHRSLTFDAFALGALATFGVLVARRLVRAIWQSSLGNSWIAAGFVMVLASLAFAAVIFWIGDLFSGLAETIRVGNGHGSYRIERVPWRQHPMQMIGATYILFWLVVLDWTARVWRPPSLAWLTRKLRRGPP